MKLPTKLASVALVALGISAPAHAGNLHSSDGLTLIWVTVRAHHGEGLWQACRRVYQRDVYKVRGAGGNKVRCEIEHTRIYEHGERLQNFNRY